MLDALIQADVELFRSLNHLSPGPVYDTFFRVVTLLGSGFLFGPVLLALYAYLRYRGRHPPSSWPKALLLALVLGGSVNTLIKITVDRDRPPLVEAADAISRGPELQRRSFPSGHTQAAFTWMMTLAFLSRKRKSLALAAFAATLVGYSRIVLGVHFPLDVTVGALIGTGSALIGTRLAQKPSSPGPSTG